MKVDFLLSHLMSLSADYPLQAGCAIMCPDFRALNSLLAVTTRTADSRTRTFKVTLHLLCSNKQLLIATVQ